MNDITNTNEVFSPNHFYKSYKVLTCASHWRHYSNDNNKTKPVKIPASLKLVYAHRWEQYNSYAVQGLSYYETNQQVANSTGLSYRTVADQVNPMLNKMGLMVVNKIGHNKYAYIMRSITDIQGELLNPALERPRDVSKGIDRTVIEWQAYKRNKAAIDVLQGQIDKIKSEIFIVGLGDKIVNEVEDKSYFSVKGVNS